MVICPYVLVPDGTPELEDIAAGNCGSDDTSVHPLLEEYLANPDGSFRDCWDLLDGDGVLDPMERQ